eukprot:TRINITY_DN10545_c0_g2_i1.p1 TRINITY_DN10545_c0_g2~~TRINITY_DN10545_c0_g2_i1.p1  ORF type:complete len:238 (+),score=15.05 TRINITY_DN10545_c0_g2_i1:160-873(+)
MSFSGLDALANAAIQNAAIPDRSKQGQQPMDLKYDELKGEDPEIAALTALDMSAEPAAEFREYWRRGPAFALAINNPVLASLNIRPVLEMTSDAMIAGQACLPHPVFAKPPSVSFPVQTSTALSDAVVSAISPQTESATSQESTEPVAKSSKSSRTSGRQCASCFTSQTPQWRRVRQNGQVLMTLCNACALRLHGNHRICPLCNVSAFSVSMRLGISSCIRDLCDFSKLVFIRNDGL